MSRLGRFGRILIAVNIGVLSLGSSDAASGAPEPQRPDGLSVENVLAWHGQGDLAFVSQGRLFVLDGSDDAIRIVSNSVAADSSPRFSPNGEWILYVPDGGGAWMAGSDGTDPRRLSTDNRAQWLADGRLLLGSWIYRVGPAGTLTKNAVAPSDLSGSVSNGTQFVFESDTLKIDYPQSSTGIERVETSSSLDGTRTLWYEERTSFSEKSGVHGDFLDVVAVLPGERGVVVMDDVDHSDQADGRPVDVIRRPGGGLVPLATALAPSAGGNVTLSPTGGLAIGAGGDRYAWSEKAVEVCSSSATACHTVRAPSNTSTLDPAWSPNGQRLALVEAHNEPDASIGQAVVSRWYRTHRLAVAEPGGETPAIIPGTAGATTPMWSESGKTLLYVANDGLWTVPADGSHAPTEIVAPLFPQQAWPSYYGEVDWIDQFSWNEGVPR